MKSFQCADCQKISYSSASWEYQKDRRCPYCNSMKRPKEITMEEADAINKNKGE